MEAMLLLAAAQPANLVCFESVVYHSEDRSKGRADFSHSFSLTGSNAP